MLEFLLERQSSLTLAMVLTYNILDTDEVVDTDDFYFNPNSDDEEMPSFWLKNSDIQIAWWRDNPERGASATVQSTWQTAFIILQIVTDYAIASRGKKKTS